MRTYIELAQFPSDAELAVLLRETCEYWPCGTLERWRDAVKWCYGNAKINRTLRVSDQGRLNKMPAKASPTSSIARTVLAAFVGPSPPLKYTACHYNDNRMDNRLSNLRWDTRSGNMLDIRGSKRLLRPQANTSKCKALSDPHQLRCLAKTFLSGYCEQLASDSLTPSTLKAELCEVFLQWLSTAGCTADAAQVMQAISEAVVNAYGTDTVTTNGMPLTSALAVSCNKPAYRLRLLHTPNVSIRTYMRTTRVRAIKAINLEAHFACTA